MAGIASTNCFVSPWQCIHADYRFKLRNSFIFHNPIAESAAAPSTLSCSYATIPISTSLPKLKNRKICDYNVKIREFCEVGNLKKAMEWFRLSEKADISSSTYCAVLQLCAELKSLQDGKEVHSVITATHTPIDGILGTRLVFMYVSCGELRQGRLVFDRVANEKVFLWNLMMNEYAKVEDYPECVYLFQKMLISGIAPDSYTFSCILKCFAASGNVKNGEWVHGYLLKLDIAACNCSVVNSLISLYAKAGRVESARKLFDELPRRDVVSWNSMISGYVANGGFEEGLQVFELMVSSSGVDIDLASAVIVLSACANCSNLTLGRAVHALGIKLHFHKETKFCNILLDMYSKCGDLTSSSQVFENTYERSVVSWTSMIQAYSRAGGLHDAIRLFQEMTSSDTKPDIFTLSAVLHSCASSGSLESGKSVHNYIMENGLESNLFVCNALMDMYAKCGSMEDASSVFSQMPAKDIISWNTIIGGYSKNDLPNEALHHFATMVSGKLRPDGRTMSCILPACASLSGLNMGREIHCHVLRNGHRLPDDRHIANALIDMYVKCGALVLSRSLFDTMIPSKDLVSWTVMIAGYGMHGLGKEAIKAFEEMRREGIEPDGVSFISVLYACSHSGLVDEGWRFFNIMQKECKIEPSLEHYACMVDLLSRRGKLQMAYEFIKGMPINPDATIWGALLCGCRIHHDVKLAERVAEHVFELEPENAGYYVLLANIYAEAEKWEEVKKLRVKIGRRGLKKHPGCSWIEVKGKVHVFVAKDGSHPEVRKIEALLRKVREGMKEEGYCPKLRYALMNGDDVEKEMALCGHSEKLAIGFGILNLPPGKTIRVMKNLRVCRDCHEMAKFMSKSTGREIILRDSNFFHHFKDGCCSCRGFW